MTQAPRERAGSDRLDFTAYVEARQHGLLGFTVLLCGNLADAEDLLQSVLARTFLRWDRLLAQQVDIDAYVRTSLVNANTSLWRRAFRRRERPAETLPEQAGDQPDPDDGELWARVLLLPERQRQVVALRYYEGLSVAETAAAMGSSEGTVKSQCARALARLRVDLGEGQPTERTSDERR
ncbi:SigE family RNA polymerase sigma factor [Nocardioides terrisoli]|uniref:SigE family RNA polymerase sigma factor n=1 Tax=Nocardioides terrisoli TaxID=3388267 RepID=UPI00287BC39C|nr:SigE family RNA polymerase sigma factor [Nocardioides marmorisolisilvae]